MNTIALIKSKGLYHLVDWDFQHKFANGKAKGPLSDKAVRQFVDAGIRVITLSADAYVVFLGDAHFVMVKS